MCPLFLGKSLWNRGFSLNNIREEKVEIMERGTSGGGRSY